MRGSQLDRRTTWEYPVEAQDPVYGSPTTTWTALDANPVYAQVQDVLPSKQEGVSQGVPVGTYRTRIRRRWRAGVTSAMRVTVHRAEGDEVFKIVGGPAEIGRRQWLEVLAERYTTD